jgi:hypothetical protein
MAVRPDVQRLMNNARVRLPGATDDAMQLELFTALDDFFKGSNVWQEDIDVTIPANDPANTVYQLVPDGPALIDKLLWVYQTPSEPNIARGPQITAAMSVPGELTLGYQPSSQVVYRCTVALTVQDPTDRDGYVAFPAWTLARYRNVMLDGLLGRMYSQPSKPWTNNQLAVFHMRKFNSGTASARVDMTRNNTYKQQPWRYPDFASGRQGGRSRWAAPQ